MDHGRGVGNRKERHVLPDPQERLRRIDWRRVLFIILSVVVVACVFFYGSAKAKQKRMASTSPATQHAGGVSDSNRAVGNR